MHIVQQQEALHVWCVRRTEALQRTTVPGQRMSQGRLACKRDMLDFHIAAGSTVLQKMLCLEGSAPADQSAPAGRIPEARL